MRKWLLLGSVLLAVPLAAIAESWPDSLEQHVGFTELIVLAEVVRVDKSDATYAVKETWKGTFDADDFHHHDAKGHIELPRNHGADDVAVGDRVVFFLSDHNQPDWIQGRYLSHSTAFVVRDDKVVYAETSMSPTTYTLAAFKTAVRDASN